MSSVREVCSVLGVIVVHLKKLQEIEKDFQHEQIEKLFNDINHVCKSDEIKQMINEQEYLLEIEDNIKLKMIDLMLRLLTFLNNQQDELISVNDSMIVQTSLSKLMSISLYNSLTKSFKKVDPIFQSNSKIAMKFYSELIDQKNLLKFIQTIINIITSDSIISNSAIEHCMVPVLASLISLKRTEPVQSDVFLLKFVNEFDQIILIRNLLLLLRCGPVDWISKEMSHYLTECIIRKDGVLNVIKATVDLDETSQNQTTHQQRFQATATVIAWPPKLCCSLTEYCNKLSVQVFHLLKTKDSNFWRISSLLINNLANRNPKLTQDYFINPIINTINLKDEKSLTEAIEMLHHLVICRQDIHKFMSISSNLFYIRVHLEDTLSHLKTILNEVLYELLSVKKSQYILDNILFNYQSKFFMYKVDTTKDSITVVPNNEDATLNSEFDIKQVDNITQVVVQLLTKLPETFKVDFFLLLLERMTFSSPSFLLCTLIATLNDKVSSLIIQHTEKAITFISSTLNRLTIQGSSNQVIVNEEEEEEEKSEEQLSGMHIDSTMICLQVLGILLDEKDKLKNEHICQLKQCITSLELMGKSDEFNENIKKLANDLKRKIDALSMTDYDMTNDMKNEFNEAMRDLNDNLLPTRAHALIVLKRLIYAKDKHVLENKTQLLNAFKMCLSDPESYIYLSAIKSLAALAIICTDDVLPVLIEEFHDNQRTHQERVNVGEVLVQLSKSIGDFAHHYSKQFIHCFLIGAKSPDEIIRVSSLSNLGQFCSVLKFSLGNYIVEIMLCVESLIKTDPSSEVKRAAIMLLNLILNGIEIDNIEVIQDQLKRINRLLKQVYNNSFFSDDVLKLHAELALEQINRIGRELLTPKNNLVKNIKILNL